ncbi:MAG: hypothetical protein C0599_04590 [Salinivirgaceae bacterium]|nr:MAG: hypothetical protein C0599_04590 [Salinivirgaceae bacterium]
MKNLVKTLVLLFVVSTLSITTLSAKTPPAISTTQDLSKAIKTVIDYPMIEENDALTTSVDVLFKIDFDGHIKVLKADGCDKYCKKVIKSLERLNIVEEKMYGRYFSQTITFELIK